MGDKKLLLAVMMVSIFIISCMSAQIKSMEQYWKKPSTTILYETQEITIFSMPPSDFQPGPGAWKVETAPAQLPADFFKTLSSFDNIPTSATTLNFAFINDLPSNWLTHIEKGISEYGNATMVYNSKQGKLDYLLFYIRSPKNKVKWMKFIRKIDNKENYNALAALDPLERYWSEVNGIKIGVPPMGLIALYDSQKIDFIWKDPNDVQQSKSFKLKKE